MVAGECRGVGIGRCACDHDRRYEIVVTVEPSTAFALIFDALMLGIECHVISCMEDAWMMGEYSGIE